MSTLVSPAERRQLEALDSEALERHQVARFNALLARILPQNRFYAEKLADAPHTIATLEDLQQFPFTFKNELLASHAHGALAANLTFPRSHYVRFHQTSGTRGRPLVTLDTAEDWHWWLGCWQYVLDAADVTAEDTVLLAFSFGPFVGFWSAFEAAEQRGCLVIPCGGMNTQQRIELIRSSGASVLLCTPSYALRLAEVAGERGIRPSDLKVRKLILAGEPGGSIPAMRKRIGEAWNARVIDHGGASEVGPWGYADRGDSGLHIMESEFIAEFLSVETGRPASEGELSELVLTNLGRVGYPIIRYRTGDLVRPVWQHDEACRFVLLRGGILGRADDMLIVRGVNIFPTAIEQIVRSFPEVQEYRLLVHRVEQMDQLHVEVEDRLHQPQRIADELRLRLGLKVDVTCVPFGSLPRFEGKGSRCVDMREPRGNEER
ncbi:MAG: phenylacetate--CoA ligase family protein [Planctomycetes bacterium]|nr:phenylacetate--CoA ligase family protein [Planctomycetota bacterium]